MNYQYGQFTREHLKKIKKGLELFNNGEYWECHEELEHWWLEDTQDNARLIYWAVIQVAASMVHYENERLPGCLSLWKKAKEKIKKAEDNNVETDLLFDYLDWNKLKDVLSRVPENPCLDDFKEVREFKFLTYFEKLGEIE